MNPSRVRTRRRAFARIPRSASLRCARRSEFRVRTAYRSRSFERVVDANAARGPGELDPASERGAPCPVCTIDQWRLVFAAPDTRHQTSERHYPVVECTGCGLGRTDFARELPDLAAIYPADYVYHEPFGSEPRGTSRNTSHRIARATGSLGYWRWCDPRFADLDELGSNPGTVLDIGCGAGRYLRRFTELGWRAEGIEPSRSAAAVARQLGFTVQTARAEEAIYPSDTFDLVTMYHSLEHCDRPQIVIEQSLAALKRGGVIAIALCNFDSPGRRFFGAAWPLLEVPRHRYHYTPEALSQLLRRYGAVPEGVSYHNDLGDIPTAMGNLAHLRIPPEERGTRSAPPDRGARAEARFQPFPPGAGRLLTLAYVPPLRAMGLSLRSSFLARFRRP